MSWNHIIEQHKATFQRDYVACHEPAERAWLLAQVAEEFPQYRKTAIAQAVQEACKITKAPRQRQDFMKCLQTCLENMRANQLKKTHSLTLNPNRS
jgi:hypothetical protein